MSKSCKNWIIAGDGLIQLHDLKAVLKACTEENKMTFSEEQLDQLALALYEDAVDSVDSNTPSASNGLEFEHLKAQLDKHPGLIDELSFRYRWVPFSLCFVIPIYLFCP